MSKEFIESAFNKKSIDIAATQEMQLSYFITSKLQDNRLDDNYISAWAERKYQTNDYFLNWVKQIFKTENFLLFFKYLRYPLPSAKVIKNRIDPQLRRVFNAEDSDFKYSVQGVDRDDYIQDLDIKKFDKKIFNKLLYKHNSILISDLDSEEINKPKRYFIDIKDVVSLLHGDSITKIAYKASILFEEQELNGYVYIDDKVYQFYDGDYKLIVSKDHDIGYCPAFFISPNLFDGEFVIRESVFTYVREELEEFTFLKTLQKMTEPNGAIPVVTKIEAETEDVSGQRGDQGQPDADHIMGSQQAEVYNQNKSIGTGDLEPGTIHEIPIDALKDVNGNINTDAVVNYLNFHYLPIEALNYLNDRLKELEVSIVSVIAGDFLESNESSKNELQIEKSVSVLENTLTSFAGALNRIRSLSDRSMLDLKYSVPMVQEVFIHYGTDFFLDSQTKLFEDLEKAPNTLERKNIIVRINQNRYKNNQDQYTRQRILYDLIPYVSDKDFETALAQTSVDPETKQYQLRFNYWVGQFEAIYGDVVSFYKELETEPAERLVLINNLILQLIPKENEDSNLVKDS